jgi:hypothetical protein
MVIELHVVGTAAMASAAGAVGEAILGPLAVSMLRPMSASTTVAFVPGIVMHIAAARLVVGIVAALAMPLIAAVVPAGARAGMPQWPPAAEMARPAPGVLGPMAAVMVIGFAASAFTAVVSARVFTGRLAAFDEKEGMATHRVASVEDMMSFHFV